MPLPSYIHKNTSSITLTYNTNLFNLSRMKKFLLSLLTILCVGIMANAAEVTFDMTNPTLYGLEAPTNSNRTYPESITTSNVNIAVDFNGATASSRLSFYNNNNSIDYRCSANGGKSGQKLTFSTTDGSNITKIEFTASKWTVAETSGLTDKTWEGNAANVTFTTSGQCVITKIIVTTSDGGTPVEPVDPVAPSNLTIKYGDISIVENDEVSVTEGTEFNISAKDATSITISDIDDNILANFDSSSCKWTPAVMEENIITVTASNEAGETATMFSLTVAEKPFTPTDVTDILTVKTFGISGTTYKEYTGTVGNAEYKAYANSNNKNGTTGVAADQIIGLRDQNKNGYGGIVTTVSPGYAVKVIATQWEKQTQTGRSLTIYGQNTPYTTGQDTSEGRNWGEKLGEIAIESGVAKELILSGGYKYIAIMPNGGACQLSEIKIEWASEKPSLPEGGLDFTTVDVEDAFTISKDAESAEITITGVHAESHLYHKFTPAATETPEAAPRKLVDHTGYTKVERNDDNTHTVTVSEPGTLELYAYHPATDSKSEIKTITVTKASGTTVIDEIGADVVDGEAEYFNLQGVKINPENATPGLYIRRQGGKVAKVVVK